MNVSPERLEYLKALAASRRKRTPRPKRVRVEPCVHLGPVLDSIDTGGCCGTGLVKLHECALRGDCTVAKEVAGHPCCRTCGEYRSG